MEKLSFCRHCHEPIEVAVTNRVTRTEYYRAVGQEKHGAYCPVATFHEPLRADKA